MAEKDNNTIVATDVKIDTSDDCVEKGKLVARGNSAVRSFSELPLELDVNGQAFVTVDGQRVYLVKK